MVFGENKRSFVTKRGWDIMLKVWPALATAQHSEKPSVLKLIDKIADKLHKNIESTEISIVVSVAERRLLKVGELSKIQWPEKEYIGHLNRNFSY